MLANQGAFLMLTGISPLFGKAGGLASYLGQVATSGYPDYRTPVLNTTVARVGDLAVWLGNIGAGVSSGSGRTWNRVIIGGANSDNMSIYWIVLNAADIASYIQSAGAGGNVAFYRGASSLAVVGTRVTTGTSFGMTGILKNSQYAGLISASYAVATATTATVDPNYVLAQAPITWSSILNSSWIGNYSGLLYGRKVMVQHRLDSYVDNTVINYSGDVSTNEYATLLELRA